MQNTTGPFWREQIRKDGKTSITMPRSVRIGGHHQIAEPEVVET
jgi:hypothetical protein